MLQELQARGVMVLVTSRRSLGSSLGRAVQLPLGALSAEAGTELLIDFAGTGVDWEVGEAERLVHICGGCPLAIKILAGFLNGQQCTPKVCMASLNTVLFTCVQNKVVSVTNVVMLDQCTHIVHLVAAYVPYTVRRPCGARALASCASSYVMMMSSAGSASLKSG